MFTFRNRIFAWISRPRRLSRGLELTALFAALVLLASSTAPSAAAQVETIPVARVLNADGTLNTSTGASGTLDLRGWNVRLDSAHGPVLTPTSNEPNVPLAVSGGTWSALGTGVDGMVDAIAISGNDVYVGGGFTHVCGNAACNSHNVLVNYIAKFDGTTWSALDTGMNGEVYAIAISGSDVYAGGGFTTAGTCTSMDGCNYIAKFNGTTWSALRTGTNDLVQAIAISGGDVYAGGDFTSVGTCISGCNNIAKFTYNFILGYHWTSLGTGIELTGMGTLASEVKAIAINGSDVYAGGFFNTAGTCTSDCNNIAKFDGTTWSGLGTGMNDDVQAIAISGSNVYAGGQFTAAGTCTVGCGHIAVFSKAKFAGGQWLSVGGGVTDTTSPDVNTIAINGSGDVYAGGNITTAGSCTGADGCNGIAKESGGTWSALGTGISGTVNAIAISPTDVYAGGPFAYAGTCGCNRIAEFQTAPAATTTTLGSSANPSAFGQSVTFTATVAPTSGSGTPTGTVAFKDGGTTISGCGTQALSSGQATCITSALSVATHTITAVYSGDTNFATSTGTLTGGQVVKATTTTTLASSQNPSAFGQSVTFTATVAPTSGSGTPTGMVAFKDGGTTITGCVTVALSSGQAICTTASFSIGTHTITADYSGDSNFNSSTGTLSPNQVVTYWYLNLPLIIR